MIHEIAKIARSCIVKGFNGTSKNKKHLIMYRKEH